MVFAMRVTIDNRLRIPLDQLSDELLAKLQKEFTYKNPDYSRALARSKGRWVPKNVPKTIGTWELGNGELSLPRGGLARVTSILGPLRLKSKMTAGDPTLAGHIPPMKRELRRYQTLLKNLCTEVRSSGCALIRSPPGSGKTTTCYAIASELNLPTLIVVPTSKIFKQWVEGVSENLGMDPSDVGIIQGSKRIVKPITVGMQQTLRLCASDFAEVFGLIVGEEVQKFGSSTFFEVADLFPAAWRIGVSASEKRADKKEFLIYDVFGPVLHEVDRAELLDAGNILDAEIRVVLSDFEAPWYAELTPLQRAKPLAQHKLADEIAENKARNALILKVLGWCVKENEPTITMARRREHCAILNSLSIGKGWNSGLLLGSPSDKPEFERTVSEMREGLLKQAVGTFQAVGVGFDLPIVSRGILASPCAGREGRQQFAQFCGRYERPAPGKTKSIVYYILDQKVFGLTPLRNLVRWKPKVYVQRGPQWVPGKQYIKEEMERESSTQANFFDI